MDRKNKHTNKGQVHADQAYEESYTIGETGCLCRRDEVHKDIRCIAVWCKVYKRDKNGEEAKSM
jgi:hypothetical protein